LKDYSQVLSILRKGIFSRWNSQLILIGTSEGGFIAPSLGRMAPETCAVLVFGGSGAWRFKDDIALLLKKQESALSEEEIELQFQMMKQDPSSEKFWLTQTYKYWAHSFELSSCEDILDLSCPVYLSIGSKDDMIESSDALWQLVQEKKKTNITYVRYEGLTHKMVDDKYTVFEDAVRWLAKELNL